MKILVTGASGFIGQHLLSVLTAGGHHVFPTSRTERSGYMKIDLLDSEKTIKKIEELELDAVINLAWDTNGIDYLASDHNIKSLDWNRHFFEVISKSSISKIISLGSSAEYFESQERSKNYSSSSSVYSKSKSEAYEAFVQKFIDTGKEFNWLRIFQVYGPGQSSQRFIPTLYEHIKRKKLFRLNNPHARLDWIDVRDVAFSIRILVENKTKQLVDIGTARSLSNIQICSYAEEHFGLDWEFEFIEKQPKIQELVASQNSPLFEYFRPNRILYDYLDSILA